MHEDVGYVGKSNSTSPAQEKRLTNKFNLIRPGP
jgi:hypothetical protein